MARFERSLKDLASYTVRNDWGLHCPVGVEMSAIHGCGRSCRTPLSGPMRG